MNIFDGPSVFLGLPKSTVDPSKPSGTSVMFADQMTDKADVVWAEDLLLSGALTEQISLHPDVARRGDADPIEGKNLQALDEKLVSLNEVSRFILPSEKALVGAATFETIVDKSERPRQVVPVTGKMAIDTGSVPDIRSSSPSIEKVVSDPENPESTVQSLRIKEPIADPNLARKLSVFEAKNMDPSGPKDLKPEERISAQASLPQHSELDPRTHRAVVSAPLAEPSKEEARKATLQVRPHLIEKPVPMDPSKPQLVAKSQAPVFPDKIAPKLVANPGKPIASDISTKMDPTTDFGANVDRNIENIPLAKPNSVTTAKSIADKLPADVSDFAPKEEPIKLTGQASFEGPDPQETTRRGKVIAVQRDMIQPVSQQAASLPSLEPLTSLEGLATQVPSMSSVGVESAKEQSIQQLALVKPADIGRHVATQVPEVVRPGESKQIEIRLNPEELGKVRISLTAQDVGGSVSIIVERPETLDLMRRHTDQLMREFRSAGWNNVELSMEQQQFSGSQSMAEDQGRQSRRPSDQDPSPDLLKEGSILPVEALEAKPKLQQDRLDLRI